MEVRGKVRPQTLALRVAVLLVVSICPCVVPVTRFVNRIGRINRTVSVLSAPLLSLQFIDENTVHFDEAATALEPITTQLVIPKAHAYNGHLHSFLEDTKRENKCIQTDASESYLTCLKKSAQVER